MDAQRQSHDLGRLRGFTEYVGAEIVSGDDCPACLFDFKAMMRRHRPDSPPHLIDEIRGDIQPFCQGGNPARYMVDCFGYSSHMQSEAQLHLQSNHYCADGATSVRDNEAMLKTTNLQIAERLRIAMDGFCKNAELAEYCDVSPTAVQQWKKTGKISREKITLVCQKLRVDPWWLLAGMAPSYEVRVMPGQQYALTHKPLALEHKEPLELGPPLHYVREIPIVGNTQAGPNKYWLEEGYPPGYSDEYIDVPSKDPNAYGLRVRGGSMYPRMKEGEVVSVSPNTPPSPGDEVVVVTTDGEVMVKELVYDRDGEVALQSVRNGDPRIVLNSEDIYLMHTVEGVHRASSVKKR